MTITLDLPTDLETELTEEAQRLGLPLSQYALRVLTERSTADQQVSTGADLVAYWRSRGLIGTRPEITDNAAHARAIRSQAERRARS